jgi:transcriptional regulator with XRE-family HTH domain
MRDSIEIFQAKLKTHRIQSKVLASEAGRSASYISEILNRKQSPTMDSFAGLVEAADRISPGFEDEYYLALAGRLDLNTLVKTLSVTDASSLLILIANHLGNLVPQRGRDKVAA